MGNPFVHAELMSTDIKRSKDFYGKMFDWKLEDVPMDDMTYTMINVGGGTGGGMLKNPIPGAPSSWMAYVQVSDIKAATAKAKTLGANVMKDVTEVMGMGWLSIITDPTGAMLGLWQAKM
jgi:predicted enzyme related to lactoylglutathione lyase